MPGIKDLGQVTENPELLSLFKTSIRRAAWNFIANPQSTEPQLTWAKKCRTNFNDDRSQFYAHLAIEGLLATSAEFRTLVDQYIASDGQIEVPDATLMQFVDLAVAIFVSKNI